MDRTREIAKSFIEQAKNGAILKYSDLKWSIEWPSVVDSAIYRTGHEGSVVSNDDDVKPDVVID